MIEFGVSLPVPVGVLAPPLFLLGVGAVLAPLLFLLDADFPVASLPALLGEASFAFVVPSEGGAAVADDVHTFSLEDGPAIDRMQITSSSAASASASWVVYGVRCRVHVIWMMCQFYRQKKALITLRKVCCSVQRTMRTHTALRVNRCAQVMPRFIHIALHHSNAHTPHRKDLPCPVMVSWPLPLLKARPARSHPAPAPAPAPASRAAPLVTLRADPVVGSGSGYTAICPTFPTT